MLVRIMQKNRKEKRNCREARSWLALATLRGCPIACSGYVSLYVPIAAKGTRKSDRTIGLRH